MLSWLFFFGCTILYTKAFFTGERIQVAGQALENAADIGSGMIAAAADAAAASAGMSAHLAGRAAAEAGAIAAAASGVSAASTLAGDVLGGQLAFGADLLSQLVPRPLQHLQNLANLAAVGLGSGTAGFLAGNAVGNALPYAPFTNLVTFPAMKLASTSFINELFGLKPLGMTPLRFYDTVRAVVDSYFDPAVGTFMVATPADFVDKLNEALSIDYSVESGLIPAIQQDLANITRYFPVIGTPLFFVYLHEITTMILETLIGGRPILPPDWHFPGLPNFDAHFFGGIGRGNSPSEQPSEPSTQPSNNVAVGLSGDDEYGALPLESALGAARALDNIMVTSPRSNPVALPDPDSKTTLQLGTPKRIPEPSYGAELKSGEFDQLTTTTQIRSDPPTVSDASRSPPPTIALRPGAPITPGYSVDDFTKTDAELTSVIGFGAADVSPVCGVITLPQIGTYPLLASITGEFTLNLPGSGQVVVESFADGRTNVLVPGVGPVGSELSGMVAVADVGPYGLAPMFVSREGILSLDLGTLGSVPVTSDMKGLTATVPGTGAVRLSLAAPARLLTYVSNIGAAPLNIATNGHLTTSLSGIGTLGVNSSTIGTLSTFIPGRGVARITGVQALRPLAPLNHVFVANIGTFPVHTQPNGAVVVPIPGLGSFPVTASPTGQLQITTPVGAYGITTTVANEVPSMTNQVSTEQELTWTSTRKTQPLTSITTARPPRLPRPNSFSGTTTLSRTGLGGELNMQTDWQANDNWVWGLSDAAVYFLQKLDIFRPAMMTPEIFLNLINQTIQQLKDLQYNWPNITPLSFVRDLSNGLSGSVDLSPMTIESIGQHVAHSLEGPFPPFSEILDHISEVITEKLEYV